MSYVDSMLAGGERVLIEAHRHPMFLIGRIILLVLAGLILIAAAVVAAANVSAYAGGALAILSLVPLGWALIRFIAWRNERYVVTNYRIIQIEGVFNRQIFDSALEKVNDILLSQSLLGRMFNYGTIQIITGSDMGLNRLDSLSDPFVFKRAILDARNELHDDDDIGVRSSGDQLVSLLAALDELRRSGVISESEYEIKRDRLLAGSRR